jgi:simple sugar transport system ATP-binding protein
LLANDVAEFSVRAGEVVALLGENGAGKSTLAKILYGYYAADAGDILVNGERVAISAPSDCRALGVGMVFQNFARPALSVFENVALFQPNPAVVPRAELAHAPLLRFRLAVDPWAPVWQLRGRDQQKVEIPRAARLRPSAHSDELTKRWPRRKARDCSEPSPSCGRGASC